MRTARVIDQSFQALKEHLKLDMEWQVDADDASELAGIILLTIDKNRFRIAYELKMDLRRHQIDRFIELKKQSGGFIIIAAYLPETIKAMLKAGQINYIDSSGNSFLNWEIIIYPRGD